MCSDFFYNFLSETFLILTRNERHAIKNVYWSSANVECVWNVMAHAQKPDLVFRRSGRVNLNRRGRQFSLLLAAEVCPSAVVMLGTLSSKVVWSGVKGTGYPPHSPVSPSLPLPCVTMCHHVSTGLYLLFIIDFNETDIFSKDFRKILKYQI